VTLTDDRIEPIREALGRVLASPDPSYQNQDSFSAHLGSAHERVKITALGAGAAYDELWGKSNLLVLVIDLALIRLDFVKEQLGCAVANGKPRLTDRRQGDGCSGGKRNIVVPHDRHIVWHLQSSGDEALEQTDRQQVIYRKYCGRPLPVRKRHDFFCRSNA
jgi:hypothetical protein